jgi:quercetin dioxygenase-like cupin family protein
MVCETPAARTGRGFAPSNITYNEALPMAFKCNIPALPTIEQDDDAVRITRWDFEPGAVTGWHRHAWPYFVTMLVDGTLCVHDGTNITDVPLKAGQSYRRSSGVERDVMNGSAHPIAFVEIEVKNSRLLDGPG